MRKSIAILVSCSSILLLCGCKEATTIQTSQPPINVYTSVANEEAAVKKTTTNSKITKTTNKNNKTNKTNSTTTTTTPPTSNSTIKDLIIDGNGNLVATKSNNTFAIIGNVQGVKGDKGERGDKGDSGSNGRGIASCNVDSNGDLIITYTDGTTQNAGNVRQEVIVHDYEQVGYVLPCSYTFPYSKHSSYDSCDITISDLTVTLVDVNENNPSNKYKYSIKGNISCENLSVPYSFVEIYADNYVMVHCEIFYSNDSRIVDVVFYSTVPLIVQNKILIG